jgi:hypothetical protein
MRHLQTESHFRLALFALQDADGYVETLLEIAREQAVSQRPGISLEQPQVWLNPQGRHGAVRKPAILH